MSRYTQGHGHITAIQFALDGTVLVEYDHDDAEWHRFEGTIVNQASIDHANLMNELRQSLATPPPPPSHARIADALEAVAKDLHRMVKPPVMVVDAQLSPEDLEKFSEHGPSAMIPVPWEPVQSTPAERRRYALLQAAAMLYSGGQFTRNEAIVTAENLLSEIEARHP